MKKGIAFAGNLILDQIKFIERYPPPGMLAGIERTAFSLGGLVCNCSVNVAKLDAGIPVKAIGLVGEDETGSALLQQLSRYPSIDISAVGRSGKTSFTDVMTLPDGSRTFFHYPGCSKLLGPEHFDFDNLRADLLHVGYILLLDRLDGPDAEYPTALCRVLDRAQKAGIKTSVDVVSEEGERFSKLVPPALAYTNYCIINEIEAGKTTGIPLRGQDGRLLEENLRPCLECLAGMGVRDWVVVHMPEMSAGMDCKSGEYYQIPSFVLPEGFIKSSVGAGDAFATGILIGAYRGKSLPEAMQMATAIAAASLAGEGASDGLVPLDTLLAEMQALG